MVRDRTLGNSVAILTCLVLGLQAAIATAAVPFVDEAPWGAWRGVSFETSFTQDYSSATTDANGLTHAAWAAGGVIKYGRFNGLDWSVTTAAPIVGSVLGIGLDASGQPAIAIRSSSANPSPDSSNLQYATFDGFSWTREIVDTTPAAGQFGRFRLGLDGVPRLAYTASGPALKYAWKDGGTWNIEQVDTTTSAWLEMDLGPQNEPHIAMHQPGTFWGQLGYYTRQGPGTWTKEIVDVTGGAHLAIAVDASGRPHLSYLDEGEDLGYVVRSGSTWTFTTIDNSGRTGYTTSLDTDQAGRPHISYRTIGAPLRYANVRPDGTWLRESADLSNTPSTGDTELHVDINGIPHIVYRGMMVEPIVAALHRSP